MALLAVAFWTPLHHLGLHYLLTAHLLQNVILAEWAPLLAVLGVSRPMAERARALAGWRVRDASAVALPLWLANYFVWHVPVGLRRGAAPPGVADPRRARLLLRDRAPRLVAARPGRAAAPRLRARARPTRSRRSCSRRRSGCCSRSFPSPSTASTSTRRGSGGSLRSPTSRSPASRWRRAGDRPLRRLPLLVPALPGRGGRYLRQPVTRSRSGRSGAVCQSMTLF